MTEEAEDITAEIVISGLTFDGGSTYIIARPKVTDEPIPYSAEVVVIVKAGDSCIALDGISKVSGESIFEALERAIQTLSVYVQGSLNHLKRRIREKTKTTDIGVVEITDIRARIDALTDEVTALTEEITTSVDQPLETAREVLQTYNERRSGGV